MGIWRVGKKIRTEEFSFKFDGALSFYQSLSNKEKKVAKNLASNHQRSLINP
jgi:hypothetical protein